MMRRLLLFFTAQGLLCCAVLATDTLIIVDKVPIWLPGIRVEQVNINTRELRLYQPRWQWGTSSGPGIILKGTASIWQPTLPSFWKQPVQWALTEGMDTPRHWRPLVPGGLALDTALLPNTKLQCWLRLPGKGRTWRWLTVLRPALFPQWDGYIVKTINDTLDLPGRVRHVGMGQGHLLTKLPPDNSLPVLKPGTTAELYFTPLPGIADSSLEYRLLSEENTLAKSRWLSSGHLLRLPAMPAGRSYRLEVRYHYNDDIFSLPIVVAPHWYQRPIWIGVMLMSLCGIAVIAILLRYRKRLQKSRNEHALLQDKLRRLQAQLNPHFVYNAISSITGIMARKEYDKAAAYLTDFGKLMRETMNYSQMERLYSLAAELTMLQHYCRLEQMRFGFALRMEVDPALDPEQVLLPPMLTHPLVENAIHHGIQRRRQGGEVTIHYLRQHHDLLIRVTDNGPDWKEPSGHDGSGTGLYVTRQRIEYLSQLYNHTIIEFDLHRENNVTVASLRFRDWME